MQTLFTGRELVELEQIDSTNNYALDRIHQDSAGEGLVVVAAEQSAGKGQRGNAWLSRAGEKLTFGVVYRPAFLRVEQQFLLNKMASLAVCDFIADILQAPVKIKWPNDIYVGDK